MPLRRKAVRYIGVTIAVVVIMYAWADSIPAELAQALERREQLYMNRYVVFRVHRVVKQRVNYGYELHIRRAPRMLHVVYQPLDAFRYQTQQGNVIFFGKAGTTCELYMTDQLLFEVLPDATFTQDMRLESARMIGSIYRYEPRQIYDRLDTKYVVTCIASVDVSGLFGVFLLGLDVSHLAGVRWKQVVSRADRWVLLGEIRAGSAGTSENVSNVSLRVELRKPDAMVMYLERVDHEAHSRGVFRTVTTRAVNGAEVPSEVQVYWDTRHQPRKHEITYKLIRFERLNQSPSLKVPLGTQIGDHRLGTQLTYYWKGRLPTEEELKRLALQQGYLLPPESPRRRHSFWLFAPAIIFFAAAGYLYWRQRRK